MAKQIKIGFDKVPAPVTKQFTQLVDIEGTRLFDAAGNPLVTEEIAPVNAFTTGASSLSVHVNNERPNVGGTAIPVVEQFPNESNVSSSLLGVPRAEEQLSLFSDVATYGLDEDQWNYYTFSSATVPYQWYQKEHPIFGRRSQPSFNEGSQEQALYLKSFPSQYNYPTGPGQKGASEPTSGFRRYMDFIALGRWLYKRFDHVPDFANKYFLNDISANIVDQSDNIVTGANQEINLNFAGIQAVFQGGINFYDVSYGEEDIQDSFDAIERWTFFWEKIKADTAQWPLLKDGSSIRNKNYYNKLVSFVTNDILPGAGSNNFTVAVLESKRAFRYQPGRASGFTFGARMKSDLTSASSVLEWGCANDTDMYMFRLSGSDLSIIRRSTIRMPDSLLTRQGLAISDQSDTPIFPRGIGNEIPMYETIIPRSKWNGDALIGTGDSGYILKFEDVTMYKIEYSWYGAIGAKFYAYIPEGAGEARWALMHTFVIENGMGKPVLQNPDFKFMYKLYTTNSATVTEPLYLYKYGSSYYVDGGDEGTVTLSTTNAPTKSFTTRTPVLGVLPRDKILNGDGTPILNMKKAYPVKVNVDVDRTARIDIEAIQGAPSGVHFTYAPCIHMDGISPRSRTLTFNYANSDNNIQLVQPQNPRISGTVSVDLNEKIVTGSGTAFESELQLGDVIIIGGLAGSDGNTDHIIDKIISDTELHLVSDYNNNAGANASNKVVDLVYKLTSADDYSKLVADGVYGVYLKSSGNGKSSTLYRRDSDKNHILVTDTVRDSLKIDDSVLDRSVPFDARLSGYKTVVASEIPIFANNFRIHWLNPSQKDGLQRPKDSEHQYNYTHFAEFAVGVTPYKPKAPDGVDVIDELAFEVTEGNYEKFDLENYPYLEYCSDRVRFSEKYRAETYEWDGAYGDQMSVDPRIPAPLGGNSGYVSAVKGSIDTITFEAATALEDAIESDGSRFNGLKRLVFLDQPPQSQNLKFSQFALNGDYIPSSGKSEIGVNFIGSGRFFKSEVFRVTGGEYYVYVDADFITHITSLGIAPINSEFIEDTTCYRVQTKVLTLSEDWQAVSKDEDGTDLFPRSARNSQSQAIAFNDQPLYPVFSLADKSRVNSIVVEEIDQDGTVRVHTPKFLHDDNTNDGFNPAVGVDTIIPSSARTRYNVKATSTTETDTPNTFNYDDDLSGLRYDIASLQPLRPSTVLYSFYVEKDKPIEVDLSNIFNVDRKGISRGLLNTEAIYFTATSLSGQSGEVELALTVKEQ